MRIFYWDFLKDSEDLKELFNTDHIIAGHSDTVIGLFLKCSKKNFDKLNEIKNREYKPYIFLVADIKKAEKLIEGANRDLLVCLGAIIWPGPITVIMKSATQYRYAAALDGTIAIRIPDDENIRGFLHHFDALFSTSANLHKEPTPHSINDINPLLRKHIDAFVLFKEKVIGQTPSTIIRVDKDKISIIRGELPHEKITALKNNGFHVESL